MNPSCRTISIRPRLELTVLTWWPSSQFHQKFFLRAFLRKVCTDSIDKNPISRLETLWLCFYF